MVSAGGGGLLRTGVIVSAGGGGLLRTRAPEIAKGGVSTGAPDTATGAGVNVKLGMTVGGGGGGGIVSSVTGGSCTHKQ